MNAIAHDPVHSSVDRVLNLWPEDPAEDALETGLWQWAGLFAATGVALVTLVLAIVLQTAYHGVILLWIWLGLPLLFVAKAAAHIGRVGIDRIRAWSDLEPPQKGEASRQEVRLSFDELALIYKSLEAVKTLGALPPQDELLEDTIQVVDQSLNTFVR
jgi:hypothetical protein